MSNNDEETFWVLEENDAFIARKVPRRNFRFKKRKGKGKSGNKKGSHQRGGFKPFRKSGSGGKANMANENYDPYDQAYWGKGKGKKGKKGKSIVEEELQETKENFIRFMEKYNRDPKRAHPKLTECERASLAHVDPNANLDEEEFYFHHREEWPSMDEFRKAQPVSGYPIKLPIGLKKLRAYDKPEVIQAFADILGSLMQPTDRPSVDQLKTHEFTPSLTINMLSWTTRR